MARRIGDLVGVLVFIIAVVGVVVGIAAVGGAAESVRVPERWWVDYGR